MLGRRFKMRKYCIEGTINRWELILDTVVCVCISSPLRLVTFNPTITLRYFFRSFCDLTYVVFVFVIIFVITFVFVFVFWVYYFFTQCMGRDLTRVGTGRRCALHYTPAVTKPRCLTFYVRLYFILPCICISSSPVFVFPSTVFELHPTVIMFYPIVFVFYPSVFASAPLHLLRGLSHKRKICSQAVPKNVLLLIIVIKQQTQVNSGMKL